MQCGPSRCRFAQRAQLRHSGERQDLLPLSSRNGRSAELPLATRTPLAPGHDRIGRLALSAPRTSAPRLAAEPGTPHWENHLDLALLPNYRDHVVGNAVVLPAAAFIEMALAAAALWQSAQRPDVENLEIQTPLLLDERRARTVRFSIDTADGRFSVRSRLRLSTDPWALHVSGRIAGTTRHDAPPPSMQPVPRVSAPIPGSIHYESARNIGLDYGPAFQTVATVRVAGDTVSANFVTPPAIVGGNGSCLLHPAFLDGCFQLLINLLDHEGGARHAYFPSAWDGFRSSSAACRSAGPK